LQYLTSFLYVSGVTQFILITFFPDFVQYSSSTAVSLIRFIISQLFVTPCPNIVGGLEIFTELGFPSKKSSFVSFFKSHIGYLYLFCFRGLVWRPVYFLYFSASYYVSIISAFILCFFFLGCRHHSLQLLTLVLLYIGDIMWRCICTIK